MFRHVQRGTALGYLRLSEAVLRLRGRRQPYGVLALDIAPTLVTLAGGRPRDLVGMQGRSLVPLGRGGARVPWRRSFMCEYFAENAMPWLHGMTYKAVRTDRWKYVVEPVC